MQHWPNSIEKHPTAQICAVGVKRRQAVPDIQKRNTAAQARALKEAKETGFHKEFGMTWQEFCLDQAGCTASHANSLIRLLDEFGEPYFLLKKLVGASAATYRGIAGCVDGDTIRIAGERVPINWQNAPRIAGAIRCFRKRDRVGELRAILAKRAQEQEFHWLEELLPTSTPAPIHTEELPQGQCEWHSEPDRW